MSVVIHPLLRNDRATAWAEPATFTAARYEILGVAVVAPNFEEFVFELPAYEIPDELARYECWQRSALPVHEFGKLGIVLLEHLFPCYLALSLCDFTIISPST